MKFRQKTNKLPESSEVPHRVIVDDDALAVFVDWFASEEKISMFSSAETADAVRFSSRFKARCRSLLLSGGLRELSNRIFRSYALDSRFEQSSFETQSVSLATIAAESDTAGNGD